MAVVSFNQLEKQHEKPTRLQGFVSITLILGDGLYNFLKITALTARNMHMRITSKSLKPDTTTVLHKAICYIRFLHDKVQGDQGVKGPRLGDLRSRGLCQVPVSFSGNMTNTGNNSTDIIKNGADLWSPATSLEGGGSSSCLSGSKH